MSNPTSWRRRYLFALVGGSLSWLVLLPLLIWFGCVLPADIRALEFGGAVTISHPAWVMWLTTLLMLLNPPLFPLLLCIYALIPEANLSPAVNEWIVGLTSFLVPPAWWWLVGVISEMLARFRGRHTGLGSSLRS